MKRTDLAKNLGLKINGRMKLAGSPQRFGQGANQPREEGRGAGVNPLIAGLLKKTPASEK